MRARLCVLVFALIGNAIARAQVRPAPAFEVASVKRNVSGRAGGSLQVRAPVVVLVVDSVELPTPD